MSVRSMGTPHFGHRRWPTGGGVVGSNLRGRGITRYSVALPITHGNLARVGEQSNHYLVSFAVLGCPLYPPKADILTASACQLEQKRRVVPEPRTPQKKLATAAPDPIATDRSSYLQAVWG